MNTHNTKPHVILAKAWIQLKILAILTTLFYLCFLLQPSFANQIDSKVGQSSMIPQNTDNKINLPQIAPDVVLVPSQNSQRIIHKLFDGACYANFLKHDAFVPNYFGKAEGESHLQL